MFRPGGEAWAVFGWIPRIHPALEPETDRAHGLPESGGSFQELHTDPSSLSYLAFMLHRLLAEFDRGDDEDQEDVAFERLAEALDRIRVPVAGRDPLPFGGGGARPMVLDDIAIGLWS